MQKQEIQFIGQDVVTRHVPIPDAFIFEPTGRIAWVQKLAYKFLKKTGALHQAYKPEATITRHVIDSDKFVEKILRQKYELFNGFHRDGGRVLIGSDDYAELMNSPEVVGSYFDFSANLHIGRHGRREILGLQVEVIPWMRGILVMP